MAGTASHDTEGPPVDSTAPSLDSTISRNPCIPRQKYTGRLKSDDIQIPPPGPFCSEHVTWYNGSAWVPENRLEDFIEGEEHRLRCNTLFKTRSTEEYFCKSTGARLRSLKRYWCTYGPKDLRGLEEQNLPIVRKFPNGKAPLRFTTLTGYSVRRGCRCHFFVTRFENRKHAVKITWKDREHLDAAGLPCHGLLDKTAQFVDAHVAPRLSKRTSTFVERLIRTGVSTSNILQAHRRNLRNHWRNYFPNEKDPNIRWSRDMMLSPRDVKALRQSVLRKKVDYCTEDHLAVDTWVANNKEKVFLYQPRTANNTIFILAWATEWQIEKAAELGHGRSIAMDATFGTNSWDLSLFTILAYDEHQNGVPVAWALMEQHSSNQLALFLNALKSRVEQHQMDNLLHSTWTPISFMIDVASEEILALREVWPGVPINLCLWHVWRAWTKNLISKVKNPFNRADINRDLGDLMYSTSPDPTGDSLAFMAKWMPIEAGFIQYYETYWHPRLERWMKSFRNYNHQNQNTNGAIERWHHTMKVHLRSEKATKCGRTVIWLLGMLTDDLELFYWCMLCLKFQGAIKNKVKQGYVWASIHKARQIADEQVTFVDNHPCGQRRAEVTTFSKDSGMTKVHIVDNFDKDNCQCTCGHSEQGNTCKHQIKVLLLQGYTEMKVFNLLGTKWGSFCGGLEFETSVMEEDTIEDNQALEAQPSPIEEVDITFSLQSFASVEVEEAEHDPPEYHEYKIDTIHGLVEKGWKKLDMVSPLVRNQALVKLREWVEWVSNVEAQSNTPELEQFPLIAFAKPADAETTLKRKQDHVERYWEKRKGKGKKKGPTPDALDSAVLPHTESNVEPFAKTQQTKETNQGMLDRMARESLNLNDTPMDFEPSKRKARGPGKKVLGTISSNLPPSARSRKGRKGTHGKENAISQEPMPQLQGSGVSLQTQGSSWCQSRTGESCLSSLLTVTNASSSYVGVTLSDLANSSFVQSNAFVQSSLGDSQLVIRLGD